MSSQKIKLFFFITLTSNFLLVAQQPSMAAAAAASSANSAIRAPLQPLQAITVSPSDKLRLYLHATVQDAAKMIAYTCGEAVIIDDSEFTAQQVSFNHIKEYLRQSPLIIQNTLDHQITRLHGQFGGGGFKFSNDSALMLSSGADYSIRVWNFKNFCSKILTGHKTPICVREISDDNKYVISGSQDGRVIFWDLENNNAIVCLGHTQPISAISILQAPNNSFKFSSKSSDGLYEWTYSNNSVIPTDTIKQSTHISTEKRPLSYNLAQFNINQKNPISCTQLPYELQALVLGYLSDWSSKGTMSNAHRTLCVPHSVGDNLFLTYSNDQKGKLHRCFDFFTEEGNIWANSFNLTNAVAIRKNIIAIGSRSTFFQIIRDNTYFDCKTNHKNSISSICISQDETYIASGSNDNTINVFKILESGTKTSSLVDQFVYVLIGHTRPIKLMQFSQDNKQLFSVSTDNTLIIWDLETKTPIKIHNLACYALAFCNNDQYLIFTDGDAAQQNVNIFNIKTGEIKKITHDQFGSHTLAISPNDEELFVHCLNNRTIKVFLISTGTRISILNNPAIPVADRNLLAVSGNGQYLVSGSLEGALYIWKKEHASLQNLLEEEQQEEEKEQEIINKYRATLALQKAQTTKRKLTDATETNAAQLAGLKKAKTDESGRELTSSAHSNSDNSDTNNLAIAPIVSAHGKYTAS